MATIIKTLTEDYIYDDEFSLHSETPKTIDFETSKMYQIMVQMGSQGNVGYGFIRLDQGIFPIKGMITINKELIISAGEMNPSSNFAKLFEEAKLKESARSSNIIISK
jgi:hypothetical protein